jgi:hypothetical protein
MSAKSKDIPIPRSSPQARESGFEELRGGLVVTDWDVDVPVAKLPLEVSAAIWSGRNTIVLIGIESKPAVLLQAEASSPQT